MSETVRDLIIRHAQTSVGPDELTRAVLAELGTDHDRLVAALDETLPAYCRVQLGAARRRSTVHPLPPVVVTPTVPRSGRPISAKVQGIRDWHKEILAGQYHCQSGYRRLADFTVTDLHYAAEERRQHAAGSLFEATRFETLAAALETHRASTVAELPADVVIEVMQRRAA